MKRVLIFSLAYYPRVSGAEIAIKEITDRTLPTDIEFHLVTLRFAVRDKKEERIGNVFIYRVGAGSAYLSKIFFIPLAALKARSLHRTHHFDALWAMMSYMVLPVIFARALGMRVPYALSLQEGDTFEYTFRRWFIKPILPLLRKGFLEARAVQAISHFLAEWAPRMGYRGIVEVIPNGASLQSTQDYSGEELTELKKTVGKKEGDIFLITVARLVHQKAQDQVIRALLHLPESVHYLIVGDGPDRKMLEKLAVELGVRERVVFVGQVDRTMTAKYRKISDIFVSPSRSEGQGISFVSAMAGELPVVATQEGGIADFLFDAKRNPDKSPTGWAVDKDNPEHIAAAVKEILANPEQTKKVVENARKLALEKYNWDTIARDMREKVFGKVFGTIR